MQRLVGPFAHKECGGEASERGVWVEICVSINEGRWEYLPETVSEQESVACPPVAVFYFKSG